MGISFGIADLVAELLQAGKRMLSKEQNPNYPVLQRYNLVDPDVAQVFSQYPYNMRSQHVFTVYENQSALEGCRKIGLSFNVNMSGDAGLLINDFFVAISDLYLITDPKSPMIVRAENEFARLYSENLNNSDLINLLGILQGKAHVYMSGQGSSKFGFTVDRSDVKILTFSDAPPQNGVYQKIAPVRLHFFASLEEYTKYRETKIVK